MADTTSNKPTKSKWFYEQGGASTTSARQTPAEEMEWCRKLSRTEDEAKNLFAMRRSFVGLSHTEVPDPDPDAAHNLERIFPEIF
jgi:hypothetical protein